MRNNFSSDDHDSGDEAPTEHVKRALLEVLIESDHDPSADICEATYRSATGDPVVVSIPPRHLMSSSTSKLFAAWVTPGERVSFEPEDLL